MTNKKMFSIEKTINCKNNKKKFNFTLLKYYE